MSVMLRLVAVGNYCFPFVERVLKKEIRERNSTQKRSVKKDRLYQYKKRGKKCSFHTQLFLFPSLLHIALHVQYITKKIFHLCLHSLFVLHPLLNSTTAKMAFLYVHNLNLRETAGCRISERRPAVTSRIRQRFYPIYVLTLWGIHQLLSDLSLERKSALLSFSTKFFP